MELDLDHLRSWIGKQEIATEALSPAIVQRFNATFDRPQTEADLAPGAAAPLLIHFCLAPAAAPTAELGPDGHPARGGFLPPVPLPRRMWAGGAFTFEGDVRIGDDVTRTSTIKDVVLKQGRTGPLCFVTVEHEISSAGRIALIERQDIVYREAQSAEGAAREAAKPSEPAPEGPHRKQITPTAPYLFRYSALTFNGHRIHYDAPYSHEAEGYPGLIVHGPMQATLLCQFAADLRGGTPREFRFRSLSTIFDTGDFTLNAQAEDGGMRLWSAAVGGPVAMEATAVW